MLLKMVLITYNKRWRYQMGTQQSYFENNTVTKKKKKKKTKRQLDKRNTNPTKNGMNRGIPGGKVVPAQLVTPLVLLLLQPTVRSLF